MESATKRDGYKYLGELEMSNFDHTVDDGLAEKLKSGKNWADYSAWNFHGRIFWDNNKEQFGCEIRQYRALMEIIFADTLEEIMEEVSCKYGDQ
jgi:hypothetical protein